VRGTVGYDSYQKVLQPNNLEAVGLSALSMHAFVDKNGDGIFNPDEQTINDVAFNLGQAALAEVDETGITRVRRLLPYTRYNIEIIESSISNPLWIPKTYAFSTITEPNIYKPINIPFYASGVIDGSVLVQTGTSIEAIPGIEIHVKSVDDKYIKNVRVFADGTFYQIGIPPGKYVIYVDSTQLDVLGASCNPPIHSFDVKITAEGDYIEGLNFLLKKQETKKTSSTLTDSVKEESITTIVIPEEKFQILTHQKPAGFVIQISNWETERLARAEAKKIKRDLDVKTIVEKVVVDGKTKYAVRAGVFATKVEAFEALRGLRSYK
jgi:hypothetical protein